ncbi:hypothetical protein VP01_149g5, partial [Puccinia sorghi]
YLLSRFFFPHRLNFVEEENSKLKDEIQNLKKMFQAVHVQPARTLTPTPRSTQPRKSLTPKQLPERADFHLDTVELDHHFFNMINCHLQTSCYELAQCLMKHPIWLLRIIPIRFSRLTNSTAQHCPNSRTNKIDEDYVQYVHATMQQWGISCLNMDWEKHWDGFNQIMSQFFIRVWKWGLSTGCFDLLAQRKASSLDMNDHIFMAIYWCHSKILCCHYKRGQKGEEVLALDQEKNTQRQLLRQVFFFSFLCQIAHNLNIKAFTADSSSLLTKRMPICMMNYTWKKVILSLTPRTQPGAPKKQPLLLTGLKSKDKTGFNSPTQMTNRPNLRRQGLYSPWPSSRFLCAIIPFQAKLCREFSSTGSSNIRHDGRILGPAIFDMMEEFDTILPQLDNSFHVHPPRAHIETIEAQGFRAQNNNTSDGNDGVNLLRITLYWKKNWIPMTVNSSRWKEMRRCFRILHFMFNHAWFLV